MIYTVTLNPSIDYFVHMDSFTIGSTNRSTGEEYYIGGKGINVSCILSELGIKSTALGFVAGFTGEAIEKGLKDKGITTDFIKLKSGISRINIKLEADDESEINCQGPSVSGIEFDSFMQKTDMISHGDTVILAGNIPNALSDDTYDKILERLKTRDIRIIVDATKNLLVNSLKYKPFLIKPNRQELSEIFDTQITDRADIETYAKKLQSMGARNVIASLGADGAILIDELGMKHTTGVVKEKVLNTIGAGDSMVAGFIAGYEHTKDYRYALTLGTACGNATAFSNGLATKEKIYEILGKLQAK